MRALPTHCRHGHEYTPDNTRHASGGASGRPHRVCVECKRANGRLYSKTTRKPLPKKAYSGVRHKPGGWQKALTHCKRGHEFTAENTGRYKSRPAHYRFCRACQTAHQLVASEKRRQRLARLRDWRAVAA